MMDKAEWSATEAKEMCVSCKSFILKTMETMKYLEGYKMKFLVQNERSHD